MEKKCYTCKEIKGKSEFNKNKSRKDGLNSICRSCSQKHSRKYYAENCEYHKIKIKKRKRNQIRKNRKFVFEYLLKNPCVDCGEFDPRVLEFDHTRDKKENVSRLTGGGHCIPTIQEEIDKCEVRCANCHSRKTAIEREYYTHRLLQENNKK